MPKSRAELQAELDAVNIQLEKVLAEQQAKPPVTFAITALSGVFADDTGLAIGDIATIVIVRGSIGELNPTGVWNNIKPGTIVEYWVTKVSGSSNKCVEVFYAA